MSHTTGGHLVDPHLGSLTFMIDPSGTAISLVFAYNPPVQEMIKRVVPHFYRSISPGQMYTWTIYQSFFDELVSRMLSANLLGSHTASELMKLSASPSLKIKSELIEGYVEMGASKAYDDSGMKGAYGSYSGIPGDPFALFFPHMVLWEWFEVQGGKSKPDPTEKKVSDELERLRKAIATNDALEILGIDEQASQDDARQAFRRLAILTHPDRPGGDPALFMACKEAAEKLKDPKYLIRRRAIKAAGITAHLSSSRPAQSATKKTPPPVLYRPRIRQGNLLMRADRIINKYLVVEIKEWKF